MKKVIKNPIFMFILGLVLATSITVFAEDLLASNIKYKKTNVESAIDDLYAKASHRMFDKITLRMRAESYSDTYQGVTNFNVDYTPSIKDNYRYFKITSVATSNLKSYEIDGYSLQTNSFVPIALNTEYDLSVISSFWIIVYSNSNNVMGYAVPTVEFYNKNE